MRHPYDEPLARSPRRYWLRWMVGLALVGAVVCFVAFGPSEEELLRHQAGWKAAVNDNWSLAVGLYSLVALALIGLSVPSASALIILAGFLFGRLGGTLIAVAVTTIGASMAMLLSRYLFRAATRRAAERRPRLGRWVRAIDQGVARQGWYYLLLLRLTPVVPFFVINFGMGLTPIRSLTFLWVTAVGMVPVALVFVNAGASVASIRSTRDLVSAEVVLSLALLLIVPLALKLLGRRANSLPRAKG